MANRLRRTNEYRLAAADLSLSARIALRFIERRIAADPDNLTDRYTVVIGAEAVTVEHNGDLLVAFHRQDRRTVSLDLVVDLKHPPDWFRSAK